MPESSLNPGQLPPWITKRLAWVQRYEQTQNPDWTSQQFGISRATLYKWVKLYREPGLEGLKGANAARGRPSSNGRYTKERTAVTLNAKVAAKLALEPNKSALVNRLLRQHYGLNG